MDLYKEGLNIRLHLYAVTQQVIDLFITVIQLLALVSGGFIENMEGTGDQGFIMTLFFQEGAQQIRHDSAVILTVVPVTKVIVAQLITEERDDALLGVFQSGRQWILA